MSGIPPYVRTTGLANWNRFAAVNDEFIDIHLDDDSAKAVGMPGVFGMGNLRIAYLHSCGPTGSATTATSPTSAARSAAST